MHLQELDRGYKVFESNDGFPQLLVLCGNPPAHGPKHVFAQNHPPVTTEVQYADEIPPDVVTEVDAEYTPVEMTEPAPPTIVDITRNPIPIIPVAGGFNPLPLAL